MNATAPESNMFFIDSMIEMSNIAQAIYLRANRIFETTPGMQRIQLLVEDLEEEIPYRDSCFSSITCHVILEPIEKTGGQVLRAVLASMYPFAAATIVVDKLDGVMVHVSMTIDGSSNYSDEERVLGDQLVMYVLEQILQRLKDQMIDHRNRELRID